jgi:hypothetical protein
MKYNQPFDQPSNPNAPYIDGNPSAGIQGSIVPAASIEYDQREIVNAISAAGLAPSNADLTQLLQTIKLAQICNVFNFSTNQGNASQWSASVPTLPIMPPPIGTALWFKAGFDSVKGGTVFSVNGSAFKPVTHLDGSAIDLGDIVANAWVLLFFDGTNWQVPGPGVVSRSGTLPLLQKYTHWYVNASTGNDTNYDGTSPTVVSSSIGPFQTLQRASDEVIKYNMNGYAQFVHVADGTYAGVVVHPTNGVGWCYWQGNPTNPQNVTVNRNGPGGCAIQQTGGFHDYDGFRMTTLAGDLDGIHVGGGNAATHNMHFGPCGRFHFSVGPSGANLMVHTGTVHIESGANCSGHIEAESAGFLTFPVPMGSSYWPVLVIDGPVNCTPFAYAIDLGMVQMHYQSITGKANVTGGMYSANQNSIIDSFQGGPNYFPGTGAGGTTYGGQYIP